MGIFENRYILSKHSNDYHNGNPTYKVSDNFYIIEDGDFELITRGGPYHNSSYGPIDIEDDDSELVVDSFSSGSGSTYITIEYKNKLVHKIEFHDYDSFELEDIYILSILMIMNE